MFQAPWQSIVSSTETIADSHAILAQKIEVDVERPLKEYHSKNREMQGISTIQGNLAAMAKELDEAQKRSEKQRSKGGNAKKVSTALTGVQEATQQWESQSPYVFEQLQALDESRVNHLRDVLTQLQTHELDQLERSRVSAERCLNALLNVDTADEISSFVARTSGGEPPTLRPRRQSRAASNVTPAADARSTAFMPTPTPETPVASSDGPSSLAPPTPTPSRSGDEKQSERSGFPAGAMQPPHSGTTLTRKKCDFQ